MKPIRYAILTLAAAAFVLSAADPLLGTWKMNVAKSKFNPGPPPKGGTVVYSQEGDWIVLKNDGIDPQGKPFSRTNRYKLDGKEYPFEGLQGAKGTIAVKRIDEHHTEATFKSATGVITIRTAISKDGKVRTQTSSGINGEGKKTNNTVVYEKQ
jgi:hypothetical protein